MLLFQFPSTFQESQNSMLCFITWLMAILMLIETIFMVILEMFDGRIYLNSVLLLLLASEWFQV